MSSTRQKSMGSKRIHGYVVKWLVLFLMTLLTDYCLLLTVVYGATANVVVNANNKISDISPYIHGQNTSSVYYGYPLKDPVMINLVKNGNIKMWRFFPGAAGQRYDFKYNNYKGKYRGWHGTPADPSPWSTDIPSVEDELRFCNQTGAEPLVEVNTCFCGPNGTGTDVSGSWCGGGDYASYAGCYLPDTAANRAKYGADMVKYIRSLCDANGWNYPVYYNMGNEWSWDGQSQQSFNDCCKAYYPAMKAVDPNIKCFPSSSWISSTLAAVTDILDTHPYYANNRSDSAHYVYAPGAYDGSFPVKTDGQNDIEGMTNGWNTYKTGAPVFGASEWGDHSYLNSEIQLGKYQGGIFTAHMIYREIKNGFLFACTWGAWDSEASGSKFNMFGYSPSYSPRAQYYTHVMYKNFGNELLLCYDPAEFNPGTQQFANYKDDDDDLLVQASKRVDGNVAIMAINLSQTLSYDTQITINNFSGMTGNVDAYVMDSTNCVEGGAGPQLTPLTGKTSPFNYTFKPFSVTCLVVKGPTDATPPNAPGAVRDGTGSDVSFTYSTKTLCANWDAATDAEIGISGYKYAIGTTAGGTNITAGWTTRGNVTSVTRVGLALTIGITYYFSVKTVNGVGLESAATNSNGQIVQADASAPGAPGAVRDGTGTDTNINLSNTSISANWDASADAESGIYAYQYAIGDTPGGTSVASWTTMNSFATGVTHTGLTLAGGVTYYFSVRAVNGQGMAGSAANSNGQYVTGDASAPSAPAGVRDGTGADISFTYSISTLSANWDAATDPESGISAYQYAVGTIPGGTNVISWINAGNVLTVTRGSLSLTVGATYYFTVKAVNGFGLTGSAANSSGQHVASDPTPPNTPPAIRDGLNVTADESFTGSTTTLTMNWDAANDAESGIVKYWYAIGTTQGGTNIAGWTATVNGYDTALARTGLSLVPGTTYYFGLKAENGGGLLSPAINSNGQYVLGGSTQTPTPPTPAVSAAPVYPNPYSLSSGQPMKFYVNNQGGSEVKIYTMSGKLVRKLIIENGSLETTWDGTNEDNQGVTRGIYLYQMTDSNGNTTTGKIAVIR